MSEIWIGLEHAKFTSMAEMGRAPAEMFTKTSKVVDWPGLTATVRLPAPSTNENPTSAPDATMLFVCRPGAFGIIPRGAFWMRNASLTVKSPRGAMTSAFSMPCAVMWLGCEPLRPYWAGFDWVCRTRTTSAMSVWPSQFASPQSVMSAQSGVAAATAASINNFVILFISISFMRLTPFSLPSHLARFPPPFARRDYTSPPR